jgi:uncharacterized protein YqiB (DUF1249 family)
MQKTLLHARLAAVLSTHPTVGGLMDLCEANFAMMQRLCPGLDRMRGEYESRLSGVAPLRLRILEQTAYTTLVQVTHFFPGDPAEEPDPEARLRVYRDARQLEVTELRQSMLPLARLYSHPGLLQKWRANFFVARWLQFCISQGHCFAVTGPVHRAGDRRTAAVA